MLSIEMDQMIKVAQKAGEQIMEVYATDFDVSEKSDQSPLTAADQAAHTVIKEELSRLYPEIPILSEEGEDIAYQERQSWTSFWLVDPLDGTKEFIKRNGEFTVNIALVQDGFPVFGVIYVPVTKTVYVGSQQEGAFKIDGVGNRVRISTGSKTENTSTYSANSSFGTEECGETRFVSDGANKELTMVESRSHPSPELEALMGKLSKQYASIHRIQKGSSLKLCAVAEGVADLYPRLGPTMEWDTAAGQAIIEAAGGEVLTLDGERFRYNKESLLNEYFLALGSPELKQMLID